MINYPPYVNAYGNIKNLFEKIRESSVPTKFTHDFLSTSLGLKSSSYRAMIPLLKKLRFLDQDNIPTETYKDYRGDISLSKKIMAEKIKEAYPDLYKANEFAHELKKEEVMSKLKQITGAGDSDKVILAATGSFVELCKLADFDGENLIEREKQLEESESMPPEDEDVKQHKLKEIGINYTINLSLPATTDMNVFNAIFKSLKEHILKD